MKLKRAVVIFIIVLCWNLSARVIVNEILYNGLGSTENEEWVELYNDDTSQVNLQGWKHCDLSSCKVISNNSLILNGGSFIILARDTARFRQFCDSIGIFYDCPVIQQSGGWNPLSNSGDNIIIKTSTDSTVDSVAYTNDPCSELHTLQRPQGVAVWIPSRYNCSPNIGGNPCNTQPDSDLAIVYIGLNPEYPSSEDAIQLKPQIKNAGKYPRGGSLYLYIKAVRNSGVDTLLIDSLTLVVPMIDTGRVETLVYNRAPLDTGCYIIGGVLSPDDRLSNNERSFLACVVQPTHLLISEVMTNTLGREDVCPGGACNEFIELYNYGDEPVDLGGWLITDGDETDTIVAWRTSDLGSLTLPGLIYDTLVLAPKGFALILDRDYARGNQPYNIPSGTLILTTNDNDIGNGLSDSDTIKILNRTRTPISMRPGSSTYAKDGYSYIRCQLRKDGEFKQSPVLNGTPGFYSNEMEGEFFDVQIDPQAFNPESPNPNKNHITINVGLPRSSRYSMKIYDIKGRLVKELVKETDTPLSTITWDGRDMYGRVMPVGMYVLVGEAPIKLVSGCELKEGARKTIKKAIAIERPIK
jgi:hypothetical protein